MDRFVRRIAYPMIAGGLLLTTCAIGIASWAADHGFRLLPHLRLTRVVGVNHKCCTGEGYTSCKKHSQLQCTNPMVTCTAGQVFNGSCTTGYCTSESESSCYLISVTRHVDKCVLTGIAVPDDCPMGKERCSYDYTETATEVTVNACDSGSTLCFFQPTFACPP